MATCSQLPTKLFANARRRAGNKCSSHEISLRGKTRQRQGPSPSTTAGAKETDKQVFGEQARTQSVNKRSQTPNKQGRSLPARVYPMRFATWNVNSIRTRVDRVIAFLQRSDTDVLDGAVEAGALEEEESVPQATRDSAISAATARTRTFFIVKTSIFSILYTASLPAPQSAAQGHL